MDGDPGQARPWVVHGEQTVGQRDQLGADPPGAIVEELGEPISQGAAGAQSAGAQRVLETAACAGEGLGEPGTSGADRGAVAGALARQRPVGAATGTDPSNTHRTVRAGPADVSVRPAAGLVPAPPAPAALGHVPAFALLGGRVEAAHGSGRIRAGRGRSFATGAWGAGGSPVAVLRTPAFSPVVDTRSAGVQDRMSHRAARTCSDNRSGVPETRRWTWEADRSMPRSRSSGTSSVAV